MEKQGILFTDRVLHGTWVKFFAQEDFFNIEALSALKEHYEQHFLFTSPLALKVFCFDKLSVLKIIEAESISFRELSFFFAPWKLITDSSFFLPTTKNLSLFLGRRENLLFLEYANTSENMHKIPPEFILSGFHRNKLMTFNPLNLQNNDLVDHYYLWGYPYFLKTWLSGLALLSLLLLCVYTYKLHSKNFRLKRKPLHVNFIISISFLLFASFFLFWLNLYFDFFSVIKTVDPFIQNYENALEQRILKKLRVFYNPAEAENFLKEQFKGVDLLRAFIDLEYTWGIPKAQAVNELFRFGPAMKNRMIITNEWFTFHTIINAIEEFFYEEIFFSFFWLNKIIPDFFFQNNPFLFFTLGFDNLSLLFIILTNFIFLITFFISSKNNSNGHFLLYFLLLFCQIFILITFATLELFSFFIAFEAILTPLFFLILIFGSRNRKIIAAYYLIFYTLFGSIPLLLGILYIWLNTGQTNLFILEPFLTGSFTQHEIILLWFLFLPAFIFKIPLYPVHLWLPEAHVEAPTVGSVILAGLLLKLGGYGFLRFSLGLFFFGGADYIFFIYWIGLLSMFFAITVACCQLDLKKLIAYGSISHMSIVAIAIFTTTLMGLESSIIMMLGHAFVSSALFILIGALYDKTGSRNIRYYGGLFLILPSWGILFFFFILLDIGIPFSPSFAAELLTFIGCTEALPVLNFFLIPSILTAVGLGFLTCSRLLFGMQEKNYIYNIFNLIQESCYWLAIKTQTELNTNSEPKDQITFLSLLKPLSKQEIFPLKALLYTSFALGMWPHFFLYTVTPLLQELLDWKLLQTTILKTVQVGKNDPITKTTQTENFRLFWRSNYDWRWIRSNPLPGTFDYPLLWVNKIMEEHHDELLRLRLIPDMYVYKNYYNNPESNYVAKW